jgi:Uma2 family endonuclease
MSSAAVSSLPAGTCLRLSNVNWKMYTQLLYAFAEHRGIRLTFDQGDLEIMAPLLRHDGDTWILGHLVFALADELRLPLRSGGSTTLRRRLSQRGLEPDACFWIANAHRIAGVRRLNLRRDPPPDLAIEVDVTHSSLDRMAIYAALAVPEVWRLEGRVLTFHVLDAAGQYTVSDASLSFPIVKPSDLVAFLKRAKRSKDEISIVRDFRTWVQQRLTQQS